jgi:PAS domain S-box-containing protein
VQWFGNVAGLLGVEPDAFGGTFGDYQAILHPDDRDSARRTLINAMKGIRPQYRVQERIVRPDGTMRWVETFGQFEIGSDGRARAGVGVLLDVTDRKQEEERRRQSEANFASAVSPDAVTLSRISDGVYVEVNERWIALLGFKREEVIGHSALDLGIWVDLRERAVLVQALNTRGEAHNLPMRFRTRDGRERFGRISATRVEIAGVAHLLAVVRDSTEDLRAESARRTVSARLSGAFRAVPDAIYLTDPRGVVIDANPAWEAMTGYTRAEMVGLSVGELGVWVDCDRHEELVGMLARHGAVHDFPMPLRHRTGENRVCRVHSVTFDASEQVNTLTVVRDVTELQRTQQRLALATTVTGIGIWELSAKTKRVESDAQFNALLGLPPEQTSLPLGRVLAEVESGARARLDAEYENAFATRGPISLDGGGVRLPSGEMRFVSLHGRLMLDTQGEPERWVGIAYDVTPLKRAELALRVRERELEELNRELELLNTDLESRVAQRTAELQRANDELVRSMTMAALGRMVAGVAHEINTPVGNSLLAASSISSLTSELRGELEGGLKRSSLLSYLNGVEEGSGIIMKALRRAAELVASFKQVAVDQISDQRRAFDLAEIVAENLMTLSPTLKGQPFVIEQKIQQGVELESYPGSLGQVLTNLVNNALLHGFDGRSHGRITVRGGADGAERVRIEVEDDGRGIPMGDQKRIFDPFFTTRLGKGGSGLGLSIVYNIVTRQLGGTIRVDSETGRGARFEILIPRVGPR